MPADTNPSGDIFGGWIMGLMDVAGGISAEARAKGRVVTASVSNLSFLQPVKVGDVVCCYTDVIRTGRTLDRDDDRGLGSCGRAGTSGSRSPQRSLFLSRWMTQAAGRP